MPEVPQRIQERKDAQGRGRAPVASPEEHRRRRDQVSGQDPPDEAFLRPRRRARPARVGIGRGLQKPTEAVRVPAGEEGGAGGGESRGRGRRGEIGGGLLTSRRCCCGRGRGEGGGAPEDDAGDRLPEVDVEPQRGGLVVFDFHSGSRWWRGARAGRGGEGVKKKSGKEEEKTKKKKTQRLSRARAGHTSFFYSVPFSRIFRNLFAVDSVDTDLCVL